MSSSPELRVVRGSSANAATDLPTPELRAGQWTRLGGDRILGDAVTEQTLTTLASSIRGAAQSQGYAVGWAQGRREAAAAARSAAELTARQSAAAEARREDQHTATLQALRSAMSGLDETLAGLTREVGEQASELALELTRVLVGRELAEVSASDVVHRVVAVLPGRPDVRVRLHPDVAGHPAMATLTDQGVVVVPDPTLDLPDAVVEAPDHALDLRVDSALDRLREVL